MKKINLIQGSEEWLEFRESKLGASNAASILGISPWTTIYQLWQFKTGRQVQKTTAGMIFGTNKEEDIRSWYEAKVGEFFTPTVVQHEEHDFMIASLDGLSICEQIVLECKTCNESVFKAAGEQIVPDYYMAQGQHQLACCGALKVVFVFCHKDQYCSVEMERDQKFIDKLIKKEKEFYEFNMLQDNEPPLSEKDYLSMVDNKCWMSLEDTAKNLYQKKKEIDTQWNEIKKQFIDCSDDGNCRGKIVTLTRVNRKGSVDLKKMAEDGIDLDKYRKPSIGSVRIGVNI